MVEYASLRKVLSLTQFRDRGLTDSVEVVFFNAKFLRETEVKVRERLGANVDMTTGF